MPKKITASTRHELVNALRGRYQVATRAEKARILSEFVAVSGYHRKHAIRVLTSTAQHIEKRAPSRPRLYDEAVRQALTMLWEASDRLCGKCLRPLLPALVDALERHGHLMLDDSLRTRLLARALPQLTDCSASPRGQRAPSDGRVESQPCDELFPVRTFADWNDPLPGNLEIDLVAQCGDTVAGSFVHTLVLTDIATGWTECLPLVVREATLVVDGIERLRSRLPFQLLGLDSDNGSEFINESMVHYCTSRGIEFTRSRPYRKNDQAWVEQKNGAVVRRLVGYHRLQGIAGAEALSRLYAASRLFVNFFQPSFKLASKTRIGARARKHYHAPQTPCARLLACDSVSEHAKHRLQEVAQELDSLRLLDEIRSTQHHVVALAAGEKLHLPPRRDDCQRALKSAEI